MKPLSEYYTSLHTSYNSPNKPNPPKPHTIPPPARYNEGYTLHNSLSDVAYTNNKLITNHPI